MKITKIKARARGSIGDGFSGSMSHHEFELEAELDENDNYETAGILLQEEAGLVLNKYLARIENADWAKARITGVGTSERAPEEKIQGAAIFLSKNLTPGASLKISRGTIDFNREGDLP